MIRQKFEPPVVLEIIWITKKEDLSGPDVKYDLPLTDALALITAEVYLHFVFHPRISALSTTLFDKYHSNKKEEVKLKATRQSRTVAEFASPIYFAYEQ